MLPVAISYSGGTSSEWLVRSVINGRIPRPDHLCVVFADTGAEHSWTYDAVREVATIIVRAIREAESDGTYARTARTSK